MNSPGQTAYEAYCSHTNWKSLVSGADLPRWPEVKPEIKTAWEKAALAVIVAVRPTPPMPPIPVKKP